MRSIAWGAAILVLLLQTGTAAARTVTDSSGRSVTVPETISKVYAAGPPASILMYVLAPDRLTGWSRALKSHERPFIAKRYRDLPETGRLTGRGDTANLETVLASKPDLIVDFGSIRDTYISLADRTETQTGIPYALIDGRFANTPAALRLLGGMLGVQARAETLANYVETLFADIDKALADIPEQTRPRVYLARGPDGLETGLQGSINSEIIERAGGRNVADPGPKAKRRGIARASIEQILVSNPDTIITWDRAFYEKVWKDPLWADVDAVKRKRVFLAPTAPFGWIDRPPSLNRIMGLKWLAGLFYPDRFTFDLAQTTREFYRLFYHVELDDKALGQLIEWASGRP